MKIGIVGGGQLAMMMIDNNREHEYFVLDPNDNASASKNGKIIKSSFDDLDNYRRLFDICDLITFEFENVNEKCLKKIESKLYPSVSILEKSKNRFIEKSFACESGINVTPFKLIKNMFELANFVKDNNCPVFIKTTTNGYDGKGQIKINNFGELMNSEVFDFINNKEIIAEKFINFDFETSCIISRNKNGDVSFIPSMINIHQEQILRYTKPLNNKSIENKIRIETEKLANCLNLIGTLCVEFYVSGENIYFNEMAPRVHNSGHHSTMSSTHNQFENAIKAITNCPLELSSEIKPTIMINLLGHELEIVMQSIQDLNLGSDYEIVDYLKKEIVDKRKRGHINICNKNINDLITDVIKISKLIGVNYEKILCN